MTDELKERLEALVADPPPPSGVPSQLVFTRVRKARRRRAAGAGGLLAAAAVAVVAVAGNLNDSKSQPPVLGPPPTTQVAPVEPPLGVQLKLTPTIKGRTMTMAVEASGTVLVPILDGAYVTPNSQGIWSLSPGADYSFGHGAASGADGGPLTCDGSKRRFTGRSTFPADPHTYPKAGTYMFTFTVRFCGLNKPVTATQQIVIK
ncbi:hypothetical protein HPO96_27985 [Kribbella sandramycini]|uniref:Uncharacterized protein n=1 Tax=Kribbella sandramycini TaxID=60450 RepID=A0A7Y4L4A1_9ACTN|nr:hypothetical protein [Kribbella sandramycini]MBB6571442.1 hypothetical protein [Kribbella sandramycini]NOL44093.1 hypothetical protein [Kribbella sandramycini]